MKIIKFNEFKLINENVHDTPEEYIKVALMKIKTKLESMFDKSGDDIEKLSDKQARENSKSLSDFGVELQSCELSRYSKTQDSVKLIYSDAEFRYDLFISIDLKDGMPTDEEKDFSDEDIKECHVKFKKYDIENFDLMGEITKTQKISGIDEDFLVSLKIEIDEKFGGEQEEFKIETE